MWCFLLGGDITYLISLRGLEVLEVWASTTETSFYLAEALNLRANLVWFTWGRDMFLEE